MVLFHRGRPFGVPFLPTKAGQCSRPFTFFHSLSKKKGSIELFLDEYPGPDSNRHGRIGQWILSTTPAWFKFNNNSIKTIVKIRCYTICYNKVSNFSCY